MKVKFICPVCGGESKLMNPHTVTAFYYQFVCSACGSKSKPYSNEMSALKPESPWNKQKPKPKPEPFLKPRLCPFCGANAHITETRVNGTHYLACSNDKCCLIAPTRYSRDEAVRAWNQIGITESSPCTEKELDLRMIPSDAIIEISKLALVMDEGFFYESIGYAVSGRSIILEAEKSIDRTIRISINGTVSVTTGDNSGQCWTYNQKEIQELLEPYWIHKSDNVSLAIQDEPPTCPILVKIPTIDQMRTQKTDYVFDNLDEKYREAVEKIIDNHTRGSSVYGSMVCNTVRCSDCPFRVSQCASGKGFMEVAQSYLRQLDAKRDKVDKLTKIADVIGILQSNLHDTISVVGSVLDIVKDHSDELESLKSRIIILESHFKDSGEDEINSLMETTK